MKPNLILIFFGVILLIGCSGKYVKEDTTPEKDIERLSNVELTPVEKGETLIIKGVKYYEDGKADSAIVVWKKALQLIPEDAEIHNWLGIVYHKRNMIDSSRFHYNKAIELNPNYYQAYNNLGYTYFTEKDYQNALKYFEKALAINPFYDQAQMNYETTRKLIQGELTSRALVLFEKAAGEDSLEVKLSYYKDALKVDTNYVDAYNNVGVTYYYLGEIDSAIIYLKKALELNENYPEANNNMGFILSQLGFNKRAINFYLKAIQNKPNYTVALINLADSYYFLKDYTNAYKILNEVSKLEPDNPDIIRRLKKLEYVRKEN